MTLDYSYSLESNIVELIFEHAIEERNRENLPTSPVDNPEEVRQTVEEDEQNKENMMCDGDNESNSPILTAVLGSPHTASPSLQQQEANASKHVNNQASVLGSENRGSEMEIQVEVQANRASPTTEYPGHVNTQESIMEPENSGTELEMQEEVEADRASPTTESPGQVNNQSSLIEFENRSSELEIQAEEEADRTSPTNESPAHVNIEASIIGFENRKSEFEIQAEDEADIDLRTQNALHILSKACTDFEISNNEETIKATNVIVDIINEQVQFIMIILNS